MESNVFSISRLSCMAGFILGISNIGDALAQSRLNSEPVGSEQVTDERQMLRDVAEKISEIEGYQQDVVRLRESAAREGDFEIDDCVGRMERRINTLATVASGARQNMDQALSEEQPERAEHEYRKIAVARSMVEQFYREAEVCVGGDAADQEQADVSWTSEGLTDVDDTESVTNGIDVVGVDPPNTSPFE